MMVKGEMVSWYKPAECIALWCDSLIREEMMDKLIEEKSSEIMFNLESITGKLV
jgi:hypothetical protein